jgi:hypothetical protein
MDKEQLAIARLQDAARLSEHRYKKPLMVTYSGGKDSQVLGWVDDAGFALDDRPYNVEITHWTPLPCAPGKE